MNWEKQLKRIRRFLRDPNDRIWDDSYLLQTYNNVQKDTQIKSQFLENVESLRVPDFYQNSYTYSWEFAELSGSKHFQCLRYYHQGEKVTCNVWEMQTDFGASGVQADEGAHLTHPWEVYYLDVDDIVRVKFPEDFHAAKYIAYDLEPIPYIDRRTIMEKDTQWRFRSGEPVAYYRIDDIENDFVIYPRPTSTVWNDVIDSRTDNRWIYVHSWEETFAGEDNEHMTRTYGTYQYIFVFEGGALLNGTDVPHGMWLFERDTGSGGQIIFISGDTVDSETGVISTRPGSLFNQETGLAVDVIKADDNILLVYEQQPADLVDGNSESEFPDYMQKYIEHGVLERAFRANTDGKIGSLSDYWGQRYQYGLTVIKKFKHKRKADRNYRLRTQDHVSRRDIRHPRLPDSYPSV